MAKIKNEKVKKSNKCRSFLFCSFSVIVISFTTYTTLKYWIEISAKYKENKELSVKLKKLKKKEAALKVDVENMQASDSSARYARDK